MERRLAAILAADVVGYSRLMGDDEEATLATLNAYREIMDRLVAEPHRLVADIDSPFMEQILDLPQ